MSAGEAFLQAAVCYHFAKFVWVLDAERNRACTQLAIESMAAGHAQLGSRFERLEFPFEGARLAANLRRPDGGRAPAARDPHPGPGLDEGGVLQPRERFLKRGMATLSMDGPGQGESGFALNIRADYEVAVSAVIDVIAGRDDVDLDRIGAVGVSMGGYYAPRAAAFEPRIKAVDRHQRAVRHVLELGQPPVADARDATAPHRRVVRRRRRGRGRRSSTSPAWRRRSTSRR